MVPRILLAVLAASFASTTAFGDTVQLAASADNTMYFDGDYSNGSGDFLFAGRSGPSTNAPRRGLLAFSLTGTIEPGSVIDEATVLLHMSRTTDTFNRTFRLHRVLQTWGEGTSHAAGNEGGGAPAAPGDATWNHRFFSAVSWTTPGGDFHPTASASTDVGGVGPYSWSSQTLAADVQGWLDDPSTNQGWILIGTETEDESGSARRFDSRTNVETWLTPTLILTFRTPSDVSAGPRTPAIRLYPNHPNPFNPVTTIPYDLEFSAWIRMNVYDVSGRVVRNLVSARRNAGPHEVFWDGRNDQGKPLPSGVYIYVLRADGHSQSRSMLLVK